MDIDHLYLGLVAMGGPAAQLLAAHGITLASARAAVAALASDDLAHLGIDAAALPLPGTRPLEECHADEVGNLTWTQRCVDLSEGVNKASDTLAVLAAMIDEPSGTIRRLIQRDGADPDALRAASLRGQSDLRLVERAPVDTGLLPEHGYALRAGQFVSAPVETVAGFLSDPEQLAHWALPGAALTPLNGGIEHTLTRGKRSATFRWSVTRERSDAGQRITWLVTTTDGRWAGQPNGYYRFDLTEARGGTEVELTRGLRTYRLMGAAIAPAMRWFAALGLPNLLPGIAYAVADVTEPAG